MCARHKGAQNGTLSRETVARMDVGLDPTLVLHLITELAT